MGSETIFTEFRRVERVMSSASPAVCSQRFTPTKKGRHSGASQSRVTLFPSGSSRA